MSTNNFENHDSKPTILVTGASGFIGRHFVNAIKESFFIYALARRSQKETGIPPHPNIIWVLGDISNEKTVIRITDKIAAKGGVDFIFHLACYYDFENKDKPEYFHTNVKGTQHLLENTEKLNIERFYYSSSLTVTDFSETNEIINETSPADAKGPYPQSKAKAEKLVEQFSQFFPCTIIRTSAIFSDWCEFGPLYILLSTWLSSNWRSKILGGHGETAIPYLHILDLVNLFIRVMGNRSKFPQFNILIASPNSCISHRELFNLATRYNFGQSMSPSFLPRILSLIGIITTYFFSKLINKTTFERPWMAKYIDKQMNVDSSKTQQFIEWKPIPRYKLNRRLLYLIENMKANPLKWKKINRASLDKKNEERPNVQIYETLISIKDACINQNIEYVMAKDKSKSFGRYQKLSKEELRERIGFYYQILETAIHYGDRKHILTFLPNLARARYMEGFEIYEIALLIDYIGRYIINELSSQMHLHHLKSRIESEITMTIQMIIDEIEDVFDRLKLNNPCRECREAGIWLCTHEAALSPLKINILS